MDTKTEVLMLFLLYRKVRLKLSFTVSILGQQMAGFLTTILFIKVLGSSRTQRTTQ